MSMAPILYFGNKYPEMFSDEPIIRLELGKVMWFMQREIQLIGTNTQMGIESRVG